MPDPVGASATRWCPSPIAAATAAVRVRLTVALLTVETGDDRIEEIERIGAPLTIGSDDDTAPR